MLVLRNKNESTVVAVSEMSVAKLYTCTYQNEGNFVLYRSMF